MTAPAQGMCDPDVTELDAAGWQALAAGLDRLPLQQSWAYGEAVARFGARPTRLAFHAQGRPVALAQVMQRRLFGLVTLATAFRGPLWLDAEPDRAMQVAVLRRLTQGYRRWRWRFFVIMPEAAAGGHAQALMRAAGMRRVMTGFSTVWVDLAADEDALRAGLAGKWRNQLARAEQADVEVAVGGARPRQYGWLLEQEEAQRRAVGYQAVPAELVPAYAEVAGSGSVLALTAHRRQVKLAGVLILIHGDSATYQIGWNGAEGRRIYAHNLLLWRALGELKQRGVRWLDLGGLDTAGMAGIARFKLGLGHPPVTLPGAYL